MKQINFLGRTFNIIEEEDIERAQREGGEQIYVVSRVSTTDMTMASPGLQARTVRTLCEKCNAVCYFDPKGYQQIAILRPEIVCVECMTDRVRQRKKNR